MMIESVGTLAAPLDQQIAILLDDALLEVFEVYLVGCYREEWFTLAHVPKMAMSYVCITTSLEPTANLHRIYTSMGGAG